LTGPSAGRRGGRRDTKSSGFLTTEYAAIGSFLTTYLAVK